MKTTTPTGTWESIRSLHPTRTSSCSYCLLVCWSCTSSFSYLWSYCLSWCFYNYWVQKMWPPPYLSYVVAFFICWKRCTKSTKRKTSCIDKWSRWWSSLFCIIGLRKKWERCCKHFWVNTQQVIRTNSEQKRYIVNVSLW